MVKCIVMYVTKCIDCVILRTISIKHKIVNFKTMYCRKYSADFTYFIDLARELY